jgi:hypothetical protein
MISANRKLRLTRAVSGGKVLGIAAASATPTFRFHSYFAEFKWGPGGDSPRGYSPKSQKRFPTPID